MVISLSLALCLCAVPAALAFDPDTANPSLVLSKDHTMVKRRSRFKQLPESAKRFTFCASVLGDEGFASGRHYWELDLENMSGWIVGAASETVNRNDDVPLTPANGFWTIRLWNGKVHTAAHGSSGSLCCSEGKPDRVGVYLDYDEGQLSFYNGSDMSHLYTFSDHFQEKLYPLALLLPNLETAELDSETEGALTLRMLPNSWNCVSKVEHYMSKPSPEC
eukprot:g32027.t1